jgi:hypothetical protein
LTTWYNLVVNMDDGPNTFLIDNNPAKLLLYSKRLLPEDPETARFPKPISPTTLPCTAKTTREIPLRHLHGHHARRVDRAPTNQS